MIRTKKRRRSVELKMFFLFLVGCGLLSLLRLQSNMAHSLSVETTTTNLLQHRPPGPTCAINLYGLPRAFKALVLPALIKNVISVNPTCDYYMHFFNKTAEEGSRSGLGGKLDSAESIMRLLKDAVHTISPTSIVRFGVDTQASYQQRLVEMDVQTLTNKMFLRKKQIQQGESVDMQSVPEIYWNILQMWHSQESVWNLMEQSPRDYDYVAMLRNDVFYANPVNILEYHGASPPRAIIPGFGRYPISDRMIFGPYKAVEAWATNRSGRADEVGKYSVGPDKKNDWPPLSASSVIPPDGKRKMMSDEIYLRRFIFPHIRNRGYVIVEHPSICFFRARAEETLWVSDCFNEASTSVMSSILGVPETDIPVNMTKGDILASVRKLRGLVEGILGRPCGKIRNPGVSGRFYQLFCNSTMRKKSILRRAWGTIRRQVQRFFGIR